MDKLNIQKRIDNFLVNNHPKVYSNKEIANYLRVNFNTTRKELGNLINEGLVGKLKFSNKVYYYAA